MILFTIATMIALIKPSLLKKSFVFKKNIKKAVIKNEREYLKYNRNMMLAYGVAGILISILKLIDIIEFPDFLIGIILLSIMLGRRNTVLFEKYTQ
jgi:hypothetical protein